MGGYLKCGEVWTGFISGQGPVGSSCESGNEPSGSIKGGDFLN